jgi:DNA-binding IclR family transcriptional regulator
MILKALRDGPATNADLQADVGVRGPYIARTCARLIECGKVRRIDAERGRGTRAVYALGDRH